jgi:TolA-binding protein
LNALVASKDFNEAEETLNEMVSDFNGHPDLPKTLYWLAERYKGLDRPEANQIYAQLVQNYPDNYYAKKIAAEHKEFSATPVRDALRQEHTEVAEVNCAAWLAPDANLNIEAEKAAVELYRIARGYEDSNDVVLAKQTYEQIIREYPGTIKAQASVLDIRRLEILEKLQSGDTDQAGVLIEQFAADFKGHPNMSASVFSAAEACYKKGSEKDNQGDSIETRQCLTVTLKMLDIVLDSKPAPREIVKTLYLAGYCHYQLGNYQKSAEAFQKIADDLPDYEMGWNALFMAAESYQGLKRTTAMPEAEADLHTRAAYLRLLKTYPDCPAAFAAQRWLDSQEAKKGDSQ